MSHGAQKMNGIRQDVERGIDKLLAARHTFRRLFLAGLTALLADAVGFAVLLVIDIQVIRELAIAASLGVAVLIFTNLILLPVALSYTGVTPRQSSREADWLWDWLTRFTRRKGAVGALLAGCLLAFVGAMESHCRLRVLQRRQCSRLATPQSAVAAGQELLAHRRLRSVDGHCR